MPTRSSSTSKMPSPWPRSGRPGMRLSRRCPARGRQPLYVRVNAVDTEFCYGDLVAVVRPGLDGIILPKVENRRWACDDRLASYARSNESKGWSRDQSI